MTSRPRRHLLVLAALGHEPPRWKPLDCAPGDGPGCARIPDGQVCMGHHAWHACRAVDCEYRSTPVNYMRAMGATKPPDRRQLSLL